VRATLVGLASTTVGEGVFDAAGVAVPVGVAGAGVAEGATVWVAVTELVTVGGTVCAAGIEVAVIAGRTACPASALLAGEQAPVRLHSIKKPIRAATDASRLGWGTPTANEGRIISPEIYPLAC
jgi:hypothetical protein